jgi:hypothetical protein
MPKALSPLLCTLALLILEWAHPEEVVAQSEVFPPASHTPRAEPDRQTAALILLALPSYADDSDSGSPLTLLVARMPAAQRAGVAGAGAGSASCASGRDRIAGQLALGSGGGLVIGAFTGVATYSQVGYAVGAAVGSSLGVYAARSKGDCGGGYASALQGAALGQILVYPLMSYEGAAAVILFVAPSVGAIYGFQRSARRQP